jgi:hypothetical protein
VLPLHHAGGNPSIVRRATQNSINPEQPWRAEYESDCIKNLLAEKEGSEPSVTPWNL